MDPAKKTTIDPLAGVDHVLARLKTFREGEAPLAVTAPSKAGITATAMKSKSTPVVVKKAMKKKSPKAMKTAATKPVLTAHKKNAKDLAFPGEEHFTPIKYGKCSVFAGVTDRKYRVRLERGSKKEIRFSYKIAAPQDAWKACVAYLKKNA